MTFFDSALAPFTMKGFYLLTWGTSLGANVWNSVALLRSYKTLPRQIFGTLQARLTPLYFSFQTLTTSTLLLTHLWFHPGLISSPRVPPHWTSCEEGHQGLFIVGSLTANLINWIIVGPWTTSVMFERHRLERLEGKEYDAENPSEAMTRVNKRFSTLHGISSALDFTATACIVGLGLFISM
ncbi:hypothetical protein BD324DRAFT_618376 [Kockovaella imperatae]|uniref:TMEM205-like domain-containing protein n=1 Tax=Kockovaella imperatae TaxID=4999 RepID=A0A1Y1UNL2_9TREE|nr:hypothetical protein BD324DRAFT_618376 [Kockovaella imperatae]ORX39056.1 hypothetical protein BD324DRAFT_618376 [Kockovaella imperatae]